MCESEKNKSDLLKHSFPTPASGRSQKWHWYDQEDTRPHRLAGFESPWLRKSWFNNPNPYPRAPGGFIPPVLHLYPSTFRKMQLSFPILAKSKMFPSYHGGNPLKADRAAEGQREGKERKECFKIWEIDSKLNQPSQGEVLNGMGKKGVKFEAFVIQMLFILVRRRGLWEIQHYLTQAIKKTMTAEI